MSLSGFYLEVVFTKATCYFLEYSLLSPLVEDWGGVYFEGEATSSTAMHEVSITSLLR